MFELLPQGQLSVQLRMHGVPAPHKSLGHLEMAQCSLASVAVMRVQAAEALVTGLTHVVSASTAYKCSTATDARQLGSTLKHHCTCEPLTTMHSVLTV